MLSLHPTSYLRWCWSWHSHLQSWPFGPSIHSYPQSTPTHTHNHEINATVPHFNSHAIEIQVQWSCCGICMYIAANSAIYCQQCVHVCFCVKLTSWTLVLDCALCTHGYIVVRNHVWVSIYINCYNFIYFCGHRVIIAVLPWEHVSCVCGRSKLWTCLGH